MKERNVEITKVENGYILVDKTQFAITTHVFKSFKELDDWLRIIFDEQPQEKIVQ